MIAVLQYCDDPGMLSVYICTKEKRRPNMSNHLNYLLEMAREYRNKNGFPDEEKARQVRSFAYGNTRLENDLITEGDIDVAVDSLRAEREHTTPICS
jgi:hypothetical protein